MLNGSENWIAQVNSFDEYMRFGFVPIPLLKPISNFETSLVIISDKFNSEALNPNNAFEFIATGADSSIHINIAKSKLSTQDVQGFKQWLQANNVTVVYQLAQEKVYECTNIDLITYANETNYVVNSGAIIPRTTLKVMSNISNTVRELQRKVSTLESYIQYVMIDALNNALNE